VVWSTAALKLNQRRINKSLDVEYSRLIIMHSRIDINLDRLIPMRRRITIKASSGYHKHAVGEYNQLNKAKNLVFLPSRS